MCYDDQAQPPLPPEQRGSAHGEDIVLTAADGTKFAAYSATTDQPVAARVLIYPDVRGLHNFYKELALRFAEVGIPALAIDYFGRTAGLTSRAEPFDFMPHVMQLQLETVTQDVQAAVGYVRTAAPDAPLFVVGFCLGGTLTLMTGANASLGFAGLIPFYAGLTRDLGGHGTAIDNAKDVQAPVCAFFGGDDQGIPQSAIDALDEQLDVAGVAHQIKVYPGAPHSFFDRRAETFATESADAWQRLLAFIRERSAA